MSLFGDEVGRVADTATEDRSARSRARSGDDGSESTVLSVIPDVPALGRSLHYIEPLNAPRELAVGDVVRVPLNGRRVRGWVSAVGVHPEPGRVLERVAKLTGYALDADVIDLCHWTARRWVGRVPTLLSAATPDRSVGHISQRAPRHPELHRVEVDHPELSGIVAELVRRGPGNHLLTVGPTADPSVIATTVASFGQCIVVTPTPAIVSRVTRSLRRFGATVAQWPAGTADALAGHTVVGGRGAVFAPAPDLQAILVLDEHDETLQNEASPTWHAREVAIERARRAGVPCILVSPMPSLEALGATDPEAARHSVSSGGDASQSRVPASSRRAGWAQLMVADRREDDPRTGLFSERLVSEVRSARAAGQAVVCILNRVGRARLLSCGTCGSIAECEVCGAAVRSDGDELVCPRCAAIRPKVCLVCGGQSMKVLRMGVTKAREDLEALLREPVEEVTAATPPAQRDDASVVIGTVAALHRRLERLGNTPDGTPEVGLVAFLDFDQELLASRYRSSEEALALLVDASRIVGGRVGRVLVQTRRPKHPVLEAAIAADPSRLAHLEWARRDLLALPPAAAVAAIGGEAAQLWVERLGELEVPRDVELTGPRDGWWLLRASDWDRLADVAGAVVRPKGRLRLRVNPMSLPG